ncbi:hypothetical protein BG000_010092 [Podila horticola]|nr:hypothetical protein BG000_010092 [Podila horticola]
MLSLSSIQRKVSALINPDKEAFTNGDSYIHTPTTPSPPSTNNWDITVTFYSATDLPRGDLLSSDPFLEAFVGSPENKESLSFVTGVKWSTLNPVWDAKWQLLNVTDGTVLEMFVKDKNKMMVDTDLGRASLLLSNIEGTHEHVLDVWKSNTKKQGQILVKTHAIHSTGKSAELTKVSSSGPARYSRHTSYAAGVLTREQKMEFYTYRVRLYHLLDVFGTDARFYQHWNTEYDAAKRIFGDNLEGLNIRNALHSQHSYLYRHSQHSVYDGLSTASDLGTLLHSDRLAKDPTQDLKNTVFTYSIVPRGLYFSETGAAFFQDFMSKHAMHANRATEVMFSGEFRLIQDERYHGQWHLLIDNNSGTYAPKKEDLHKVKEVFERNFPDLIVSALDREDPYLKEIRAATKAVEQAVAAHQSQPLTLFGDIEKSEEGVLHTHNHDGHACEV